MRKKCSSDREKLLKFKAQGREFARFLRSLEQFIYKCKFFLEDIMLPFRSPIFENILLSLCTEKCSGAVK